MNTTIVNTKNIIIPGDFIVYGTSGYWAMGMAVDVNNNSLTAFIVADDCGHSQDRPVFLNLSIIECNVCKASKTIPNYTNISNYDYIKNIFDSKGITLNSLKKQLVFK